MINKNNNSLQVFLVVFIIVIIALFSLAIINITPEIGNMQLNLSLKSTVFKDARMLSSLVVIAILTIVFILIVILLFYSFNLNIKADFFIRTSIIDSQPSISVSKINTLASQKTNFIIAYIDVNEDLLTVKDKRYLSNLIEQNYKIYINHVKLPISKETSLYSIFIKGELVAKYESYNYIKPYLKEIYTIENKAYKLERKLLKEKKKQERKEYKLKLTKQKQRRKQELRKRKEQLKNM